MILHLVSKAEWEAAPADMPYIPAAFAQDGFIHCSGDESTLLEVANTFYRDIKGDVLVLSIDEKKLTSPLKWEAPALSKPAPPKTAATKSVLDIALDAEGQPAPVPAPEGESVPPAPQPAATPPPPPEVLAEVGSSFGGPQKFPHIYGPLNRDAIVLMRKFLRMSDGYYAGYEALPAGATTPAAPSPSKPKPTAPKTDSPLSKVAGKTPGQLANEVVDATDEFSEALSRYQDRLKGKMDELDKNIDGKL